MIRSSIVYSIVWLRSGERTFSPSESRTEECFSTRTGYLKYFQGNDVKELKVMNKEYRFVVVLSRSDPFERLSDIRFNLRHARLIRSWIIVAVQKMTAFKLKKSLFTDNGLFCSYDVERKSWQHYSISRTLRATTLITRLSLSILKLVRNLMIHGQNLR